MPYVFTQGMSSGGTPPEIYNDSSGNTIKIGIDDTYEVPTVPKSGLQSTTFTLTAETREKRLAAEVLMNKAKHIVFPEGYQSVSMNFLNYFRGATAPFDNSIIPGSVEEITHKGSGTCTIYDVILYENLKKVHIPNASKVSLIGNTRNIRSIYINTGYNKKLEIYVGEAGFIDLSGYNGDSSVDADAPGYILHSDMNDVYLTSGTGEISGQNKLIMFGGTYGLPTNCQEVHLEECTNIIVGGNYSNTPQGTFYFPKLTEFVSPAPDTSAYYNYGFKTNRSIIHFGPDLRIVPTQYVSNLQTMGTNGNIYIPQGDTATKATLDALSITYQYES